jgi:hypothetical protein
VIIVGMFPENETDTEQLNNCSMSGIPISNEILNSEVKNRSERDLESLGFSVLHIL